MYKLAIRVCAREVDSWILLELMLFSFLLSMAEKWRTAKACPSNSISLAKEMPVTAPAAKTCRVGALYRTGFLLLLLRLLLWLLLLGQSRISPQYRAKERWFRSKWLSAWVKTKLIYYYYCLLWWMFCRSFKNIYWTKNDVIGKTCC